MAEAERRETLLKVLLTKRHLATHRAFCREYDKVARKLDRNLITTAPGREQYARWLAGKVKTKPSADRCRGAGAHGGRVGEGRRRGRGGRTEKKHVAAAARSQRGFAQRAPARQGPVRRHYQELGCMEWRRPETRQEPLKSLHFLRSLAEHKT